MTDLLDRKRTWWVSSVGEVKQLEASGFMKPEDDVIVLPFAKLTAYALGKDIKDGDR